MRPPQNINEVNSSPKTVVKWKYKREMSDIDINKAITVQGQAGYVFPPFPS